MRSQFGNVSAMPVATGERVIARLIIAAIGAVFGLIYVIGSVVWVTNATSFDDLTKFGVLTIIVQLALVGVAAVQIVLNVTKSTSIGGKVRSFHFIKTDTGEEAKAMVFVKYLLQGLFESATFGLGAISYFVTHRDGQHWIDRALNLVAVETDSAKVGAAPAGPMTQQLSSSGPRVMPVQMPQRPAGVGGQAPMGAPSGAPGFGTPGMTGAPFDTQVRPGQAPVPNPPYGGPGMAPPASAPAPAPSVEPVPASNTSSNPWALPQQGGTASGRGPARTGLDAFAPAQSATPFTPPAVPQSPPVQPTPPAFTPPGQAPLSPVAASSSPPPAPAASPSLTNDETVVDPEYDETAAAVLVDDGQRIVVDSPVVLGRNPSPPEAYPYARSVQVIDESMRLSKSHLVLVPLDGGVGVFDVGATNGVHMEIAGQKSRLAPHELHSVPGDAVIHFGGRNLRVEQ